jgi:hypothetical protein
MGATNTINKPTNGFKLADGIKNIFSTDKGHDKSSEQYILNPTEIIQEQETFEQSIDRQKEEIDRLEKTVDVEVAKIQTKKIAKIRKNKAKRKTFSEWVTIAKTKFSESFEKHKSLFVIEILLFCASIFFHAKSFEVFLGIFLSGSYSIVIATLALLIAIGLETLAVALYSEYKDALANSIYFVSLSTILGMGVYQYSQGQSITVAAWRTGLGSIMLIGLYVTARAIREMDFWGSRKNFNELPAVFRKEINTLLEKILSEHKNGNDSFRGNFKDILKTYNLKSASLEKLLVRKGMREKIFIAELPARRRDKKKIARTKKAELPTQNFTEKDINKFNEAGEIKSKIIVGLN